MIDPSAWKIILIDDRKSWTSNNILYTFRLAECMYKSGFACAHIAMKPDHLFIINSLPKPGGCIFYVIQFISEIHRAKIFVVLQRGVEDYQLLNWPVFALSVFLQQNLQQVEKELLWKMYNGK